MILRIFTGYIEWAFRHPNVKYLSDWTTLNFLQKLQSYLNLTNLSQLQGMFTSISNNMMHDY